MYSLSMELETPRLKLRQWSIDDLPIWIEMNQDTQVRKYFSHTLTEEEAVGSFCKISKFLTTHEYGLWAVEKKENQEFIGYIGLSDQVLGTTFSPFIEIGWRLKSSSWGKGFATEGAKTVLEYGLTLFPKIFSITSKLNTPSIKVMEKIGLVRDESLDFEHPAVDSPGLKPHLVYTTKHEK